MGSVVSETFLSGARPEKPPLLTERERKSCLRESKNSFRRVQTPVLRLRAGPKGRASCPKTLLNLAAAAAALCLSASSYGAIVSDITSISTTFVGGTSTTLHSIAGGGTSATGFLTSNSYTVTYEGGDLEVNQVNTGSTTYNVGAEGTAVVRRDNVNPNTDVLWYAADGNISTHNGSTIKLDGPQDSGYNQALSSNNLLVGANDIFANMDASGNNDTDVERIDMIYSNGISTGSGDAFEILDRNDVGDHAAFKIAAITSLDSNGNPASYGPLMSFSQGSWGNTALLQTQGYAVLRENNTGSGSGVFHPSDQADSTVGGVVIPVLNLIDGTKGSAGPSSTQTIYGYSLFAADTTGNGSQLVNYLNSTYFPTCTDTNDCMTGGLNPLGATGELLTPMTSIPEPSAATLAVFGSVGILTSRRRRRRD